MTNHRFATLLLAAAVSLGTAGCASKSHGPDVPIAEKKALEKTKNPINLFDKDLKDKLASEISNRERLEDGRIAVTAMLRNRTKKPLALQTRVVFKDELGLSTGDESAWTNLYLEAQQAQTIRVESKKPTADLYTLEVRKPPKV